MSARVPAWKMSGAGNDFVVLAAADARALGERIEDWVRAVCRRGVSVGADGVLIVGASGRGRVTVSFYNPDASRAFCGNGTRCAARFASLRGIAGTKMVLDTEAGDVPAEVEGERVRLELPLPRDTGAFEERFEAETLAGRVVVAGVPHAILQVADAGSAPLARWGPWLRRHPRFGEAGTNVDVMQHLAPGVLALRTWERGVEGETLACGSAALAAAFLEHRARGASRVTIQPASRIPLVVEFPESGSRALLSGDARVVLEGEIGEEAVV